MGRRLACAAIVAGLAACGDGSSPAQPDPAPQRPSVAQGFVTAAGSAAAPGGHRVVGGVLGDGGEARGAQHAAKGGVLP